MDDFGYELRCDCTAFISKKAKHTFSGYAHAQLKRIKTHRSWLLNPPKAAPCRADFGLNEIVKVPASELGAYDAAVRDGMEFQLPENILTIFTWEKQFQSARIHYDQYLNWVKSRNPARAELEAKFGYDTKHGMHLLRLMRMCKEIMATGCVNVKRADREELLAIRRGQRSYELLIEEANALEAECEGLYNTSGLRPEANKDYLNELIVGMTDRYLQKYGLGADRPIYGP